MEGEKHKKIAAIRLQLGVTLGGQAASESREFLSCSSLAGFSNGVPRGVLCEVTGSARTEWMIALLRENPTLITFWAEDRLTLFPTALQQRGVDLSRILLAETGPLLFQTIRKALRSKLFDCVILPGAIDEIKMLKALQLFARESNASVFFLSKVTKCAWTIPFQISVDWDDACHGYQSQIIKAKGMGLSAV